MLFRSATVVRPGIFRVVLTRRAEHVSESLIRTDGEHVSWRR